MTDTELILREIDNLRQDVREYRRTADERVATLEDEVSELRLQFARTPAHPSTLKRDGGLTIGAGAVGAILAAVTSWLAK